MKRLRALLVSVSALASAVPGYKSIESGIGTPPEFGGVFGGAQIATSALVLLLILLFRTDVERMSRKRIVRLAAVGMVVLMAVAATYLSLLTLCTVRIQGATSNDDAMTFFFPLVPRGELAIAIDKTSRQDVANRYRRGMDDILRAQGVARTVTIVVLLALHVTTFAMLVALFAVVALRVGAKPRGRASPAMAEAEPRAG